MSLYDFYEQYFLVNLNDYPNIGIDLEITKILFYLLIGVIAATVIVNYRRASMNIIVKKLLRYESMNEDGAKTLSELGISTLGVRWALSSQNRLTKIVRRQGEVKYTYEEYSKLIKTKGYKEEKINFDEAKFYIDEGSLDEARVIADMNTTSPLNTALFCILLVAVYICIMVLIPDLLTFINNLLEK